MRLSRPVLIRRVDCRNGLDSRPSSLHHRLVDDHSRPEDTLRTGPSRTTPTVFPIRLSDYAFPMPLRVIERCGLGVIVVAIIPKNWGAEEWTDITLRHGAVAL
jgi:hypothetical protein